MQIYQRIRNLREDSDLTQAQVAEKLYMKREVYRRYETGDREPPFNIMIQISNLYNVSLDYLANITDKKERNK